MAKSKAFSKKELGERVRTLRIQKGLTQVELAKKLGMTQSNISELERGIRGLTIRHVLKLANILSASTDEILLASPSTTNGRPSVGLKVLRRAQRIQELPASKQRAVLELLDALLDKQSWRALDCWAGRRIVLILDDNAKLEHVVLHLT